MTDEVKQPLPDIKTGIFENFLRQYQSLTSFINALPLDPVQKSIALGQLYLGYLAGREAIAAWDMSTPIPKPEETSTVN